MRLVSVTKLTPDMVLAKSIYYNNCLLLKAGQYNLDRYLNHLSRLGFESVYIEDSKSAGIEIPDAISDHTRIACKNIVYQTMTDFSRNLTVDISRFTDTISVLIDDITLNSDVQISLNNISATDEYTFNHSVNTTVYSMLLAKRLNYTRPMLEKLAAGTLLHDLGKVLLDKKILLKEGPLTQDEFEYIKQHTTLGYNALKDCENLPALSKLISLYHHENMDATGYPTGTPAGSLHEFVRIVAVADVFDALTSTRCYRRKWSNLKAADYLIEIAGTKLDLNLVSNFIQQIAVYPNGSTVQLSNQTLAIIKDQNKNMPLRPIVRVFADSNGKEIDMYEIDLMKELNITILDNDSIEDDKAMH